MTDVTTDTTARELAAQIRAKLDRSRPAKLDVGPLAERTQVDIEHGIGLDKPADNYPAINLATTQTSWLAHEMERVRIEGARNGKAALRSRRHATSRARAQRKAQVEATEALPGKPDPERLAEAWMVVVLLHPIIQRVARSKRAWATRYLGDVLGDVVSLTEESMVRILAKGSDDLDLMCVAAQQLSDIERDTGSTPGNQSLADLGDDERKRVKRIRRYRKWLMSVVNMRVTQTVVDLYRAQPRWENIDLIDTVAATINGAGDDPAMKTFKVDKAPSFLGTKFPRPGGIDGNLVQTALMAAITDKGLDALVEVLLHDDNRRTDGAIKWTDTAQQVFLAAPDGYGEHYWQLVEQAANLTAVPRRAIAEAAKRFVQQQFEWLPSFLVSVVDAFDQHAVSYHDTADGSWARLASSFEAYLPDDGHPMGDKRFPLQPALRFASVQDAARVLAEHVSFLLTGEDMLEQILSS